MAPRKPAAKKTTAKKSTAKNGARKRVPKESKPMDPKLHHAAASALGVFVASMMDTDADGSKLTVRKLTGNRVGMVASGVTTDGKKINCTISQR